MKVLVTGAGGQLGYDIVKVLANKGIEYRGIDIDDLDLTDAQAVYSYLEAYGPDTVIHCAAYTAVDNAEDNRETVYDINVNATGYLAEACKGLEAKMVYFSTDYVFDGHGTEPFETGDECAPVNYYGYTKWQGEQAVVRELSKFYILRISWAYGRNGSNFVNTMLRLAENREEVTVVCDQIGSPTYTPDVAELTVKMIETGKYGYYHVTNEGFCSWYEFAQEIFRLSEKDMKVNPIDAAGYYSKAKRPVNSRLSKSSLDAAGFDRLPHWKDALKRYLSE